MDDKTLLPEDEASSAVTEARLKQAAAMAVAGANKGDIRKKLNMSAYGINKLYKDERFNQMVTELGEDALVAAKAVTRVQISKLATKAIRALEANLDRNSMAAVTTVLKAMGLDGSVPQDDKQGGFTLVLANSKPEPKTVNVVREDDNGDSIQD